MTTKEQLQNKIDQEECLKKEREISDRLYAIKLVEKIVFWFAAAVGAAIVAEFMRLILK